MITAIVSFPNFYRVGKPLFQNFSTPTLETTKIVRRLDSAGGNPFLFLP